MLLIFARGGDRDLLLHATMSRLTNPRATLRRNYLPQYALTRNWQQRKIEFFNYKGPPRVSNGFPLHPHNLHRRFEHKIRLLNYNRPPRETVYCLGP